jgi:hypothetical protein
MKEVTERTRLELLRDLIGESLRVRDPKLNELAGELLTRMGHDAVSDLVRVAANTRNRPDHRIRALEVIARIGPPYDAATLDLAILLQTRSGPVREAVHRLFGNCLKLMLGM